MERTHRKRTDCFILSYYVPSLAHPRRLDASITQDSVYSREGKEKRKKKKEKEKMKKEREREKKRDNGNNLRT